MAHLFVDVRNTQPQPDVPGSVSLLDRPAWAVAPLEGSIFVLRGSAGETLRPVRIVAGADAASAQLGVRSAASAESARSAQDPGRSPLVMRSLDADAGENWIAVTEPGGPLRVNGIPLMTGVRMLRHRDELRLAGVPGRAWFSLECRCEVAPFDGPADSICPRCKQGIEAASPSLRCPQCRVYYHESAEFPCWTYAPTCAFDDQPTDPEAGFRWTPEEFERHA